MHPQQKHAWFNLIVTGTALLLSVTTFLILMPRIGVQRATGGFGFLGIAGLTGFAGMFYRRKSSVVMDERDHLIREKADLKSFRATWLYWILGCVIPWLVLSFKQESPNDTSIPAIWLPIIGFGAFAIFNLAWSVTVLLEYGKSIGKDAIDESNSRPTWKGA